MMPELFPHIAHRLQRIADALAAGQALELTPLDRELQALHAAYKQLVAALSSGRPQDMPAAYRPWPHTGPR